MMERDEVTRSGRNDLRTAAAITVPRSRKLFCSLQFWGQILLQMLAMSFCIGIAWCVLLPLLNGELNGTGGNWLSDLLRSFPRYLLMAGAVCSWVYPSTLFQNYYPVLISMNATRRRAVLGIWLCTGAEVMLLSGFMALCASLGIGEIAMKWLPPVFGVVMSVAALGVLIGILILWNRVVWIIFIAVLAVGVGVILGFCTGAEIELAFLDISFWEGTAAAALSIVGTGFYLLAGALAMAVMRRIEVR
ncbi:MAG: hypothetical protein LUD18_13825 [Lachnospiraceae bacterium]|nr:hypothetical protein [Lachnospiraceae bacterium]